MRPTLQSIDVEKQLLADAQTVLSPGETLSDFVAGCIRDAVRWRRIQDGFLARASASIDRGQSQQSGVSADELLRRMDELLEAAQKKLRRPQPPES